MSTADDDKYLQEFNQCENSSNTTWTASAVRLLIKRLFMQEELLREFRTRIAYLETHAGNRPCGSWWKKDPSFEAERNHPLYPDQAKGLSADDLMNEFDTVSKRMADLLLSIKKLAETK